MVPHRSIKFLLILTLVTLSCGLFIPASPAVPTPAPATQAIPQLTAEQLKNAQYELGARDDHALVQLVDGKYQQGTDTTTLDFAYIALTDFVSLGDLTGDGVNEIAAVFLENYGGTGNFGFLALYQNQNGVPVFVTSLMIDDRPQVNGLGIENNEIMLDAIVHDFDDGGCCPTFPTRRWYRVIGTTLHLMKFTSVTPGGQTREIKINLPVDGDISHSVQVKGDVTIAPFENNLSYHVIDLHGAEMAAGPLPVTAPDPGAPGTFDSLIDLSLIPAGSTIFLQIEDLSAADGSLLAMDSVQLVVK